MTREEAIRIATGLRTDFKCESNTMVDFCNTIIKVLEQEPILERIRAEIESEPYISKMEVLDIINKYKAESEA